MNERQVFTSHLRAAGFRGTRQRHIVLDTFLSTERHVSVDDLYRIINRGRRRVGYATVHRTMKLIAESGLACEVMFDDGVTRFEHCYGQEHQHHHHLICTRCRKVTEFASAVIDREEKTFLRKYGFEPHSHRYEIFGLCASCLRKTAKKRGRQT